MAKRNGQMTPVDIEQLLEVEAGSNVIRSVAREHEVREGVTVPIELKYRLDLYTPAMEARFATADETGHVGDAMAEAISGIVTEWNLHIGGELVALERGAIMRVPVAVLALYLDAVFEDADAANPTKPGTGNGSGRSRAQARSRAGRR